MADSISLKVNGVEHKVSGSDVSSDTMLVDYVRNTLELRGTKYMCREGGCGACIVNASTSSGTKTKAVNSCLVSVASCHDWDITTIEGLGNKIDGYHKLQTELASSFGTQCGYCSPGWLMSMNGLLETNKDITMMEVEEGFGSNLCRCTGYRPVIECFKKFAKNAPKEDRIMDIENLALCKKKAKASNGKKRCEEEGWCVIRENEHEEAMKKIELKDGKIWYRPTTLTEVLTILKNEGYTKDYMLVAGNTAKGAFPIEEYPSILIDISHLPELKLIEMDQNLVIGAGSTLTEFLEFLKTYSTEEYFSYLQKVYDHMLLVAHIPLRNICTIAGNLMIKHAHNGFQSDVFLLLETVGAQVTILDYDGNKKIYTMQEFLKVDMKGKVLFNILLPPLSDEYELVTYKIMPRAQSAHAIVNAGFLLKIDKSINVCQGARIVYGALSAKFIRATATESYLVGKPLFNNETLQAALKVLDGELIVEDNPPEPSVEYRRHLAKALFYKCLLTLCPPSKLSARNESAIVDLHKTRGLSSSKQIYSTDSSLWPLNQAIVKAEALHQCTGEALYVDDIPSFKNEVFAAFVLSTVASGTIVKIDATEALKMKGVLAFYTAKDIPGLNSFTPADSPFYQVDEEVLAEGTVKHFHQPLGIIVADSQHTADRATKFVKVKYSNVNTKPVCDIKTAKADSSRNTLYYSLDATSTGTDIHKVIKGENSFHGQYHFTMETLVAVTKPTEEGIEVHSSTQWLDGTHVMLSRALGIDQNKIDVHLRRIGGGYGLKISRSIQSAIACALVTMKHNRPCRLIQPLTTNMMAVGKRMANVNEYEVGVNSSGVIQYLNTTMYEDNGYKINETVTPLAVDVYNNCYDISKINYKIYDTITDTAKNTFCRSPGTLEAIAACEYVMERISYELSLDPVAVRLANLDKTKYSELVSMLDKLKTDAEYVTRRAAVDSFNTQNRWKKRGLRFAFVRWAPAAGQRFDINMSVYHGDGSIVITHAAVEMGQGINTKAAQIVAHLLNVPVTKIQVKANNTIIAPNSFLTGSSITTQNVTIAVKRACAELLARLEPIKATLTNPTWEELIKAAFNSEVDLQVHGFVNMGEIQEYVVYGMVLAETEIDCLTGEHEILRVDLLQDVGLSFNPEIDIGQVEGGFVMALGYWTCEKLKYSELGELLTNRTWDYHLAEARDIPKCFNIYLKENSYSNDFILGCKGVGEPSTCAAVAIPFSLREAICMARQESGVPTTEWFSIDGPFSAEAICMATKTRCEDFKFM